LFFQVQSPLCSLLKLLFETHARQIEAQNHIGRSADSKPHPKPSHILSVDAWSETIEAAASI
jgi:hypothetical protein